MVFSEIFVLSTLFMALALSGWAHPCPWLQLSPNACLQFRLSPRAPDAHMQFSTANLHLDVTSKSVCLHSTHLPLSNLLPLLCVPSYLMVPLWNHLSRPEIREIAFNSYSTSFLLSHKGIKPSLSSANSSVFLDLSALLSSVLLLLKHLHF